MDDEIKLSSVSSGLTASSGSIQPASEIYLSGDTIAHGSMDTVSGYSQMSDLNHYGDSYIKNTWDLMYPEINGKWQLEHDNYSTFNLNNDNNMKRKITSEDKTKQTVIIDANSLTKEDISVREQNDYLFITGSVELEDEHTGESTTFSINERVSLTGSHFDGADVWTVNQIRYENGTLYIHMELESGTFHDIK